MDEFSWPKGAIQSHDQIWIGRRLWDVVGPSDTISRGLVEEVVVASSPLKYNDAPYASHDWPDSGLWCEWLTVWNNYSKIDCHSLRDRNIGAHYNNNFLFATEEDALAFLKEPSNV